MPAAVFLSYVEEDSAIVLPLARELRLLDHSTWTFEENGVGGRSYIETVHDAVCACPAFLLMASTVSVRSHQVLREVELAHSEERAIVPVLIDLTTEQLRSAHRILKVVIGTTTPVRASGASSRELAARVHAALADTVETGRGSGTSAGPAPFVDGLTTYLKALEQPPREPVYDEMTCIPCGGLGKWASVQKPGKWNKCRRCNGTGRVRYPRQPPPISFKDL
jgi:hypothetical protein